MEIIVKICSSNVEPAINTSNSTISKENCFAYKRYLLPSTHTFSISSTNQFHCVIKPNKHREKFSFRVFFFYTYRSIGLPEAGELPFNLHLYFKIIRVTLMVQIKLQHAKNLLHNYTIGLLYVAVWCAQYWRVVIHEYIHVLEYYPRNDFSLWPKWILTSWENTRLISNLQTRGEIENK